MINSFHDFVGGPVGGASGSDGPRPYIYVIEYILTKDDCEKELKEYILGYKDSLEDYEDDKSYDSLLRKLKNLAEDDDFDEIEELVYSYDPTAGVDYDEDDDDFETKMYNPDYQNDVDDIEDIDVEELKDEVENSYLSDDLKSFLKVDIEFEDLFDEDELESTEDEDDEPEDVSIESDEDEFIDNVPEEEDFDDIEDADFEEIKDDNSDEVILKEKQTSGVEGVLSDTPVSGISDKTPMSGTSGKNGTSGAHTEDCPACIKNPNIFTRNISDHGVVA